LKEVICFKECILEIDYLGCIRKKRGKKVISSRSEKKKIN